jgi:hypothetical protein
MQCPSEVTDAITKHHLVLVILATISMLIPPCCCQCWQLRAAWLQKERQTCIQGAVVATPRLAISHWHMLHAAVAIRTQSAAF